MRAGNSKKYWIAITESETTGDCRSSVASMGNQITAIAPAQILPLESYFNDLTDYGKPIRSALGARSQSAKALHPPFFAVSGAQGSSKWLGRPTGAASVHPYIPCSHSLYRRPSRDYVEVVVKVFAKHDSSLNLKSHENKLHGRTPCLDGCLNPSWAHWCTLQILEWGYMEWAMLCLSRNSG